MVFKQIGKNLELIFIQRLKVEVGMKKIFHFKKELNKMKIDNILFSFHKINHMLASTQIFFLNFVSIESGLFLHKVLEVKALYS